jgi:hypothetical protein
VIPAFVLPFPWVPWAVGVFDIMPCLSFWLSSLQVPYDRLLFAVMLASFLVSVLKECWFPKGKINRLLCPLGLVFSCFLDSGFPCNFLGVAIFSSMASDMVCMLMCNLAWLVHWRTHGM